MAAVRRVEERRPVLEIPRCDVTTGSEQETNQLQVSQVTGVHQRCAQVLVAMETETDRILRFNKQIKEMTRT